MIGHSVEGREIRATRVGPETARVNVLVVGDVHGNEPAGEAIVARLRRAEPPEGVALWLVRTGNPDGRARSHASQCTRGGPQPQLPVALAAGRRAACTSPGRRPARSRRPRR